VSRLRVALVAGTLGQGGAEKQFVYMATALADAGVDVRTCTMIRGEYHARALEACGLGATWVGRGGSPPLRAAALCAALARFRPHVIQGGHFFTNLYVTLAGRLMGAAAVGAIRSDVHYELATHGRFGPWSLRAPPDLIANSWAAKSAAEALGRDPGTVHVVSNAIDLAAFDGAAVAATAATAPRAVAIAVGSLLRVKRLDRFLDALALARRSNPGLSGIVVGHGPERPTLEHRAGQLGLLPDGVRFLGARDDVPALLAGADFLVLTSDHEGFPNVALEAMAARLPVIATPCGDIERLVGEDASGFIVPFDDPELLAERMARLAQSPELRRRLGAVGREMVERTCSRPALAGQLLSVYRTIAARRRSPELRTVLA
jgi:glycosyltransferase involved in cell wall biosynthesis